MKIVVAGGTGQLGTLVARAHHAAGYDVVVLSRAVHEAPWRVVAWDAKTLGAWSAEVDGADVVMNLAGRSVNCRYTPENRRAIMDSRVDSTRAVGAAIAAAAAPPKLWVQMSTATLYAHRYDAANDEFTGVIGGSEPDAPAEWRFSIDVVQAWERAVDEAVTPGTRKVKLRAAVVMTPGAGGPFDVLLRLVRCGLGGTVGDGRQYISWVHGADFVRAVDQVIRDETLDGAVNVSAPNPLPNAEFMRDLRAAWGMPIGLPAPGPLLAIGARVIGTETELALKSRRVVSAKLAASGFTFDFPTWDLAARDLCARVRRGEG
ncbi:MAG TPA: TIGR01777 family oxidoreductase [Candidatus Limnocylindrales bacterium]|nr:TIGR01777 family oxidoreductase [Candidatus Limnocylindrales bacterium]